jgi:hypothetical protein
LNLPPYPLPVGVAVVEEGLKVVFEPFVSVILGVLTERFGECLFVDVLRYFQFQVLEFPAKVFFNNISVKHVLTPVLF